ncbi:AAA family ATPase [Microbacterium sp. ZW T5_56]|uniref:AAA family ATPase n=1 Tax=Microbacterium sp. ZW T5_56 TaxID=3378081 RepID=UPI00385399A6
MNQHRPALVYAEATSVLGEYDHKLSFAASQDHAIIYGPNGVGKTKFLEIIHAMHRFDGRTLSSIPFNDATLRYEDGTKLHVGSSPDDVSRIGEKRRSRRILRFSLTLAGQTTETWDTSADTTFDHWLLENTPWRPSAGDLWEDFRDGETLTLEELATIYPEAVDMAMPLPRALGRFRSDARSYLIETQRLRIENDVERIRSLGGRPNPRRKHNSKIVEHSGKMRSLVNDAQTEHSAITQQLDRTFPHRVLERATPPNRPSEVRDRYEQQNEFRSRLGRVASVELAEALSLPDRAFDESELRLLTIYLDDTQQKLAPFELLLHKIELFEAIVNTRLLRKKLRVTAKDGLLVRHATEDRSIDLDSLSSGEQHEIILMFDLLFNVPPGALVMIDEPEISLHVVWQLAFIPDVQRIAELGGFRFIVATHSPQIINDSWDRATPLGPEEARFV